jgi:hypothetical protein
LACNFTKWSFDPVNQTYSTDATASCTAASLNMDIFRATAAENSSLIPADAAAGRTALNGTTTTGGRASGTVSQQTFTIGAVGSILTAGAGFTLTNGYDGWTIDQNKQLKNTQSGLF